MILLPGRKNTHLEAVRNRVEIAWNVCKCAVTMEMARFAGVLHG